MSGLVGGIYAVLILCFCTSQVLGKKPDLPEGDDNDDMVADISNRKSAKLYMVKKFYFNSLTVVA